MAFVSPGFAFLGYSIHNIALAGQKIGFALAFKNRARGILIWILATLSMPVGIFAVLYAVSIGSPSLVGAMAGSGLASLAVFSHLVMRERIEKKELLGVFTVFAAAVLIGAFGGEAAAPEPPLKKLYIYFAALCGIYLVLWILLGKRQSIGGIIIAGFSGVLGGFVPLFQKISTSPFALSRPLVHLSFAENTFFSELANKATGLLSNPWALTWIGISVVSMLVMQFAYRKDRAIRLIPAFAANTIAVPVVGALLAFGEHLHPLQWLGIAMIIIGVLLITVKSATAAGSGSSKDGTPKQRRS